MAFGQTWHGLPQLLLVPAMRVLQDLQWVEELQQHHRNGQVPLWTPQIDQDCNNQFRFNQQRITKTSIPGSPWRAAKNKSKPDKSAHNLSHSARHEKHIQHACTRQQSSILQVSTCESFENSHNTKVTDINHTESYPCQFHQLDAKQQRLRFFPFEHFQSPNSMMPSPGHAWKQPQELIYIYISLSIFPQTQSIPSCWWFSSETVTWRPKLLEEAKCQESLPFKPYRLQSQFHLQITLTLSTDFKKRSMSFGATELISLTCSFASGESVWRSVCAATSWM